MNKYRQLIEGADSGITGTSAPLPDTLPRTLCYGAGTPQLLSQLCTVLHPPILERYHALPLD